MKYPIKEHDLIYMVACVMDTLEDKVGYWSRVCTTTTQSGVEAIYILGYSKVTVRAEVLMGLKTNTPSVSIRLDANTSKSMASFSTAVQNLETHLNTVLSAMEVVQ
jgi:hypothetical protein